MTEPLRILLLAANPLSTNKLALDAEHRLLRNKMSDNAELGNCELLVEWAARLKDLKERLKSHKPHVVHFAGHGTEDGISLEDDKGESSLVNKAQLADLFGSSSEHLRLVVLNACFSAHQAEAINQSVDYVVGTKGAVADDAAVRFAAHFYEALATGKTVREAHYKSQVGLEADWKEQIGQYELFVRSGTDETRPLLLPVSHISAEYEIGDVQGEDIDFTNVSLKGAAAFRATGESATQKVKATSVRGKKIRFTNKEV